MAYKNQINYKSFVVLIQGGSSSGKSTFSNALIDVVQREFSALLLRQDDYYKDLSGMTPEDINTYNFDIPDAIDMKMFVDDIHKLCIGESIQKREYDFIGHKNHTTPTLLHPAEILICEGLFVFNSSIKSDLNLFLDVDADIRFIRRLLRDQHERGILPEETIRTYLDIVKPMHERYIEPAKKKADIILSDSLELNESVMMIFNEIKRGII